MAKPASTKARGKSPGKLQGAERSRKSGASVASVGVSDKMDSWRAHHAYSARVSLHDLLSAPLQSIMIWLVIAIALSLPGALLVVIDNIQLLSERWDGEAGITVYLEQDVADDRIDALSATFKGMPVINRVDYISPEQALQEFGQLSGFGDVLGLLEENPLPAVFLLQPAAATDHQALPSLLDRLQAMEGVELVQMDLEWVEKLELIISLAQRGTSMLAVVLVVGIVLSVGNTISLAIESRRDEIVVAKLVGATDAFVRRPFLYTGVWYGLVSGGLGIVLLFTGTGLLEAPVARLATLYESDFALRGLDLQTAALLLLGGTLLGYGGAWLAVSRHLHDIQPR